MKKAYFRKQYTRLFLAAAALALSVSCSGQTQTAAAEGSAAASASVSVSGGSAVASSAVASSAGSEEQSARKRVILSLYNDNNPWPIALANDIKRAAAENDIELQILNASGDPNKQFDDVAALKKGDVDMLLLSALEMDGGARCLEHCKQENIPVILVGRNADGLLGSDAITFIGCDYELVGYTQALSLCSVFGDAPCNVVILGGEEDFSTTTSLNNGFIRALRRHPNIHITAFETASTGTREALDTMESIIQSGTDFQAVFCHSDADALGAIQALKTAGLTPGCSPEKGEIVITSNCGYDDAIKAVSIGELYSTIDLNAHLGDVIVSTMKSYWNGYAVMPRILISYKEITKENVSDWIGRGY